MRSTIKFLPFVYPLVFIALAIYRLVVVNSDVLFQAQEQSFWQPGSQFFGAMLKEPGGIFSWVGCYLTQFFFHPALGASILIALWVVIYAALYKAMRLPWYLGWIALIPSSLLLWSETALGYAIYVLVVPDYWFTPTLFILAMSLLAWLGAMLPKYFRIGWLLVVLVATIVMAQPWVDATLMPKSVFRPFHSMAGDDNYRREMRMYHAAEEGRWAEVINEYSHSEQNPTRAMWMLKNVAMSYRDRLDQDWLKYNNATQPPVATDSIMPPLSSNLAPLLYYLHGCIGFSYRWSMENNVEYGISYQRLCIMTRCALAKGEFELADKYLTQLERTAFHGKWASEQRKYIENPQLMSEVSLYSRPIALSKCFDDKLDGDNGDIEEYLTRLFALYKGEQTEEMSQLCMMYAIQSRDIATFWSQFSIYASSHMGKPMPKLYQEVACLYGQLNRSIYDPSHLPFSEDVLNSCYRFLSQYVSLTNSATPPAKVAQSTRREFGHTAYWFYYFNQ